MASSLTGIAPVALPPTTTRLFWGGGACLTLCPCGLRRPRSFMQNAFGSWNATGFAFPYFATPETRETLDVTTLKLADLYNWIAAYGSGAVITSQFTSMYDWNQAFFRLAMLNDDTPTREVAFVNEQAWSAEARRGLANLT